MTSKAASNLTRETWSISLDGGLCVLDGFEQVAALGFQEAVARGGLVVLLERHHVDRAHGFHALLEGTGFVLGCGQRVALHAHDRVVYAQRGGLHSEIVEAGGVDVFDVGGELGGTCGQVGALLAQLLCLVAQGAEFGVQFGHAGAQFSGGFGQTGSIGHGAGAGLGQGHRAGRLARRSPARDGLFPPAASSCCSI